jgi:hypothetical protein
MRTPDTLEHRRFVELQIRVLRNCSRLSMQALQTLATLVDWLQRCGCWRPPLLVMSWKDINLGKPEAGTEPLTRYRSQSSRDVRRWYVREGRGAYLQAYN